MSIEVHVRIRPGVTNSAWTSADTVLCSTVRQDHRFPFSRVYNTSSSNNTIFGAVDPLIHAAFEGKNVTIMAYGQTGSGKTHSMVGTSSDSGVMRRTAEILANLRAAYPGTTVDASCIEIHNETVSDLLLEPKDRKPIDIRGDGVNTTYEKTMIPVTCLQDFVQLHASAERFRRYGVTDLNGHSSRSHIILSFHVKRPNRSEASVINLVDLAGSESAGKANTTGETLREGGFINRSLLALGNVVSDIVAKKSHIAFRGSSLTRLLSPCLSGDGYTFILCCINPGAENYDQTVNALQFSQRAMKIKKDPTVTLTNMPPLFTFPLHKQLMARQAQTSEVLQQAYQTGLYDTYTNLQSVLGLVHSKQQKAIADAQQEAFNLQAQLIAKDHLSSLAHLKRQREVVEAHRQRKVAAIGAAAEKDRSDRDMAHRMEDVRSKKLRAESEYNDLLADSKEAKAQWRSALTEAIALAFEKDMELLCCQEQHARLEIEAQRPLFLEQLAERMMSTSFPKREEVMRALGCMAVPPAGMLMSESITNNSEDVSSPTSGSSSRLHQTQAKLEHYKQQLQQQWTDLNAAAKAVREMDGDFAMASDAINPALFNLSEREANDMIARLEREVSEQQQLLKEQQLEQQQHLSASSVSPPPTSRHGAVLMPARPTSPTSSSSMGEGMSRLKSAVASIADAKSRMKNGEILIASPDNSITGMSSSSSSAYGLPFTKSSTMPTYLSKGSMSTVGAPSPSSSFIKQTSSYTGYGSSSSSTSVMASHSPNAYPRATNSSTLLVAKRSGMLGASTRMNTTANPSCSHHEDPMTMSGSFSSNDNSVAGIAARRKAEGIIRGRSRV